MDCSNQASLSFTILQSLLTLMCIELVMSSSHLIFCSSLLLLPSIFPSSSFCFNELALHIKRPNYWGFSFSISCSNEYSRLISFRIDLFDLLLETLKNLFPIPQYKNINSSALSFLYCPTLTSMHNSWKNHSFDYVPVFVGKIMALLYNILPRFVIAFLPRSNCLLISWLRSSSTVTLEPK